MKWSRVIVLALFLIAAFGCVEDTTINDDPQEEPSQKEPPQEEPPQEEPIELPTFELIIKKNNLSHRTFVYNELGVSEERTYEYGVLENRIAYSKDTVKNVVIKIYIDASETVDRIDSIFYKANGELYYMISYHNTSKFGLYHSNIYQLFYCDALGRLIQQVDYDSTHHHFLELSYEYDVRENINYKYYPLNTGLPQDSIYYDDNKSIYSLLPLPQINELAISRNNIIKIKRRRQMLFETKFEILESVLYTSTYEYDNDGYPTKEIRKYSESNIETFTYSIIENLK